MNNVVFITFSLTPIYVQIAAAFLLIVVRTGSDSNRDYYNIKPTCQSIQQIPTPLCDPFSRRHSCPQKLPLASHSAPTRAAFTEM